MTSTFRQIIQNKIKADIVADIITLNESIKILISEINQLDGTPVNKIYYINYQPETLGTNSKDELKKIKKLTIEKLTELTLIHSSRRKIKAKIKN